MFNRIIKRGNRKVPKSDASEPAIYPYGATAAGGAPVVSASNVTVNHASRTTLSSSVAGAAPNSHPQASSGAATAAQIEALPLFRDVPVPERQALFLRKLQICAMVFDFSDTLKSAREKETKRQTLLELVRTRSVRSGGRI